MSDDERNPDHYRPNVGLVVFHTTGLVFLGKRVHTPAPFQWQFPQGGMDDGETPRQAALRELEEETGIAPKHVELLEETDDWLYYEFPPGVRESRGWTYRGQRQKWFALRFIGHDSDIRLDAHTPEFSDWRWASLDQAVELVIPFKRPVYEEAARRFQRFASGARS